MKDGTYLVSASSVGHRNVFSNPLVVAGSVSVVDAGVLQLVADNQKLKEVVVQSKKQFIERKPDRTVLNVDASITNAGATAMEILEKSPGVLVDKDGNISLKGKQGVVIFIDGKPSYLSGPDLANMLKSMAASQLDQVEIMTNPPAKYDAAGNAGIINIKTKKIKTIGYNGSISSSFMQGKYSRTNESLNLNYRNKTINLFGNYGFRKDKKYAELTIIRKFRDKDTRDLLSIFDQKTILINDNTSNNAKLGIDINLSKKTTVGAVVSGFINGEDFSSESSIQLLNRLANADSSTFSQTQTDSRWKNFSANVNLRHVFDSTGRELSFDADYVHYTQNNNQTLGNRYFDAFKVPHGVADSLLSSIPSSIKIYSAKADYTQNLPGKAKLEAGVKASFVTTDNDARYNYLVNGTNTFDTARSNHFIYEEQIRAAYINMSKPFGKKWSTQLGLRVENTFSDGNQVTTGQRFERNYTQLFPTAFISYDMNSKNNFSMNYGRRIERPDYGDLNPFYMFIDKYTYQAGNTNLKPQVSHNIELTHTYAGNFTTTLNYSKTNDLINDVIDQDESKNETFITKSNIASQEQVGISSSAMIAVKKWLTINLYANFSNNRFIGFINNAHVDLASNLFSSNLGAQFDMGKGWNAELNGFYRSSGLDGVLVIGSMGALNAGIAKSVLKNKGNVKLGFRDILWTQKFKGSAEYAYIDTRFTQQRDSRQVSLSFNWRFGNAKIAAPKRKSGGASSEQNRVKAGG